MGISVDEFLFSRALAIATSSEVDQDLQSACSKLCNEYAELFKPELGCLRDVELEIEFKSEAKPIFMKPRPVPFAIQEDLARAYDTEIARDIWIHSSTIGERLWSLFENHHFPEMTNQD